MSIVQVAGVRREIGDFVILDGVSATIAHGDRIGLVGANGAGKTTLLRLIARRDEPDRGRIQRKQGLAMGLLTQEANLDASIGSARTLRAWVRGGAAVTEEMERELATLEAAGAAGVESRRYAELVAHFEAAGGYALDQRVDETLSGLGFDASERDRPPLELSGGEQTRAALARLMVADPDLLLLDEPTNHLDIAALEWLEVALRARTRALLVASHDRAFLDAVATRIWELRDRRLESFRGGYSSYLVQREERDARQRKDAEASDAAAAREEELIQRYRSHRKYTKMHEHERRLEQVRAARAEAPRAARRLALPGTALLGETAMRSGEVVLSLDSLVAGFPAVGPGDHAVPVVRVERIDAMRGERIGIVGPNGAGKTTLLRTIAGDLPPLAGFVRLGHAVAPGYLAQLRGATLGGTTVLDALSAAAPVDSGTARSYLARFLFRGDDVYKPVAELSGGERSRLELALLGITTVNLLLLDEPTNHLDIPAREALEGFLRETPATVIVVSHDRRLLETLCDRLWVVEAGSAGAPGSVAPFDGRYPEWRAAVAAGWAVQDELARRSGRVGSDVSARATANGRSGSDGSSARRDAPATVTRRTRAAGTAASQPSGKRTRHSKDAYRRQKQLVEDDLTRLGLRKSQLELALGDGTVQSNFVELRRITSELADVDEALARAEDAWLLLEERAPR